MRSRSSGPPRSGTVRRRSRRDRRSATEPAGSAACLSAILSDMDQPVATADAAEQLHVDRDELDAAIDHVRRAPAERGTVELIAWRPAPGYREVVEDADLDIVVGLVGDCWSTKRTSS